MTHRVEWQPKAQLQMLELWATVDAGMAARISAAILELERRLSTDPANEGESRAGKVRITFEPPFGINFSSDPDDRLVSIDSVWLCFEKK